MGHGGSFDRSYGQSINPIETGIALRRAMEDAADATPGPELALVDSYDFDRQRVSVRLKNRKEVGVIHDVPIAGSGGDLKHYFGFKTIQQHGETQASIGWLIYLRTDSALSLDKRGFTPPRTAMVWTGEDPIFVPLEIVPLNEARNEPSVKDKNATAAMADKLGPGDSALVHKTGSHIIFKANGDLVIKAANKVYIGNKDTAASAMKKAARDGDNVRDDVGDDTIDGGSDNVFIG